MSRTEFHTGKLKKIRLEEYLPMWEKIEFLQNMGYELEYLEEDYSYFEFKSNEVLYLNGSFYENIDHKEIDEMKECILTENKDGTLSYVAQFYNGGTCIEEVLADALKKDEK
jgi:hypothetical protein